MYYTDDSILPENMAPLIITAAPYGPAWLPGDADVPVTWDEQIQAAVHCYNAGATILHVHVRNPETGHGSADFDQFSYMIGRLKQAVPKMILQVGGSISFAPKTDGAKAKWLDYDTRHMLTELDPKPEFVTTVRLSREFGREVATAEAARDIMKVGVWYNDVAETLRHLGLPPNRDGGETGFIVPETDGRRTAAVGSDSHPIAYGNTARA